MFLTCKSQLFAFSFGSPRNVGMETEILGPVAVGAAVVAAGVIAFMASLKACINWPN